MSTLSQETSAASSICTDDCIERLEASLRRLGQRSTDLCWPSAESPPLSQGSADRAGDVAGTSRSRDPERPLATVREGRISLHDVLLFLTVGVAAASIAYLVARSERSQYSIIAADPGLAYAQTTILPPTPVRQNATRPTDYQTAVADSVSSSREMISTAAIGGATPAASSPAALNDETVMSSSASETQIEPASPPRRLDPAEIQFLIDQGKKLMAAGDFVAARIVLRRAAQAGDSGAAFAMGGTYDPLLLKKIGAMGVIGDPDAARTWYEKAQQSGSLAAAAQTQSVCDSLQAALCRMSLAPQRHGVRSHIRRQRN